MIYVDEMIPGLKSHRRPPYTEACHRFLGHGFI